MITGIQLDVIDEILEQDKRNVSPLLIAHRYKGKAPSLLLSLTYIVLSRPLLYHMGKLFSKMDYFDQSYQYHR
jgi:hypothetical protein